jgi:hypothetical protein
LTLHDDIPGIGNRADRVMKGDAMVAVEGGVAALANAAGPMPAIAQVIPAMTVKRFKEDNMSVSFYREIGATVDDFGGRESSGAPAALLAETHRADQQDQRWRRTASLALAPGTVLSDLTGRAQCAWRAIPLAIAAFATASATDSATRRLKTLGTIYSV